MQKESFWEDLRSGQFASMVRETSRGQILQNSRDVYNVIKPLAAGHEDVETMYGTFLNSKNRMVGLEKLFSGSITGASVYPREIVKRMITLKANALILAQNHPSECTLPSPEDQHITFRVAMALSVLDACLHDHIIIGDDFYSMADAGVMKTINSKVKQILS